MLGSRVIAAKSAASYSMTGRATVGSFHEDLRKVHRHTFATISTCMFILHVFQFRHLHVLR